MDPTRWIHTLPLRLRSIFRRRQIERELAEEFEYHLEMKIQECIAEGMTPEEARCAALRAMDGMERHKEECRDARGVRWMNEFFQDSRYAVRILAKSPGFTIIAVMMLALGIGANTAVVSAYHTLIFQSLPFGQIDRLVEIPPGFNYPNYLDIRADDAVFSDVAVWMVLPLGARSGNGQMLSGRAVSSNFFQVVGLPMTLGRGFLPEEDKLSGSPPVAVISYRLWEDSYEGDPEIVGKTIKLNDESFTIVGVAPQALRGDLGLGGIYWDLWVPIPMFVRITHLEKEPMWRDAIESRSMEQWLWSYGRLKPGITVEQAKARMTVLFSNLQKAYPGSVKDDAKPNLVPMTQARWPQGNILFSGVVLAAATLCILLITCTNIANLLLARGSARQREIATRLALGAGRARVVRQLLAEGFVLSAVALILSLVIYHLTLRLMSAFEIPFNYSHINLDLGLNNKTLIFAIGIGLLANLMFGLAPALAATRIGLGGALKDQGFLTGFRKARGRRILAMSQIILTVVLLVGAGILGRMVWHFVSANPGFDRNVLVVPAGSTYGIDKPRRMKFYQESLQRVRNLPGVRSAAWAAIPPFDRRGGIVEHIRPELPGYGNDTWFTIQANAVSPGYFRTLGIPILQGRDFADPDSNDPVAGKIVINETMARRFWPGTTPIGKLIRVKRADPKENRLQGLKLCEVIGIVKDVKYKTPWEEKVPYLYLPYWHWFYMQMSLHVSTSGNPNSMIAPIQKLCRSTDSADFAGDPSLIATQLEAMFSEERSAAYVLGISGSLALLLAAIGLYGIISYSVTQRTREFGIRMALGARGEDISRQVTFEGLKMAALGLAIGLSCSMALSRFLVSRLHGMNPLDPITYVVISVIILVIASLAAFLPARRAAANPMNALRLE